MSSGLFQNEEVAETAGDITQNANFAISLETIRSFLDTTLFYASKDSTEAKNYADIAAEAMRYTVLLECTR